MGSVAVLPEGWTIHRRFKAIKLKTIPFELEIGNLLRKLGAFVVVMLELVKKIHALQNFKWSKFVSVTVLSRTVCHKDYKIESPANGGSKIVWISWFYRSWPAVAWRAFL